MAAAAAAIGSADWMAAASAQIVEAPPVRRITVTVNKSKTLKFDSPFASAVIGSPAIADVLPMTERTLYIQGKTVGTTNVSVFNAEKRLVAVVDLDVEPDTATLGNRIATSAGSRNISVTSVNGQVVLGGEASDAVAAARAVDVAKGLAKDGTVIDAMRVAPSQQVMLKVRFLEVDRSSGRALGVNWYANNNSVAGVTGLGKWSADSTVFGPGTAGLMNLAFPGAAAGSTPFGALLAQVINVNGVRIDNMISALEDRGLVRTLAEPNLIALSGQPASFFAGGQIPIPTVQPGTTGTVPTVTVTYYSCGVQLNFVPTVLNSGVINVSLAPQVCEVSTSASAVSVNGTTIPELTTRSANTTVALRDGQSFAIAGLLEAQSQNDLAQLPWLGSLPVLGALFRSTSYQKHETDLVVIVTPHLVRPAAPATKLATPFDTTLPANDPDLFLMGDTERKKKYTEFVNSGGGLQGPYGHVLDAK